MSEKEWRPWGILPIWWEGEEWDKMRHQYWLDGCQYCRLEMPMVNNMDTRHKYIVGFSNEPIFRKPEEGKDGTITYDRDGAATMKCPRCQRLSSYHIGEGITYSCIDEDIENDPNFFYWPEARTAYVAMVAERDKEVNHDE